MTVKELVRKMWGVEESDITIWNQLDLSQFISYTQAKDELKDRQVYDFHLYKDGDDEYICCDIYVM